MSDCGITVLQSIIFQNAEDKPLKSYYTIFVDKSVKKLIGTYQASISLRNGNLMIKCENIQQMSQLLNSRFLSDGVKSLFFREKAELLKILNVKNIFNTVKKFRANSAFQGKGKLLKNPEQWKYFHYRVFSVQRIHLGVIRAIWASVMCNMDESRGWL